MGIETDELDRAIKKLKNRKSRGPDGTTVEVFKAMTEESREEVRKILNQWWEKMKLTRKH